MTALQTNIRIVIPAYNAEGTIRRCVEAVLAALEFHHHWEVVLVDNGNNTDLLELIYNYPVTVLKRDISYSAAYARNEGAKGFGDGILVFIDSDVVCEKKCIENLINPILQFRCNATIGNYSKNIAGLSFSQKYKQLYINHIYDRGSAVIKNDFWTAICAVNATVFNELNGFNTDFKGANGEDQEFGIRLTKGGFNVLPVRDANGQHLNPYGVFNIIRNDLKKGLTAVKNSLDNNVPFSDNRHSKWSDIISVFFAVMTFGFLLLAFFQTELLPLAVFSFTGWVFCRNSLSSAFLRNGGFLFFLKAIVLMFCLDLVRFNCVVVGVIRNKILNSSVKENVQKVSYPAKA